MPRSLLLLAFFASLLVEIAAAQIPKPNDAPQPKSPEEEARTFKVPDGFRVELVASEPLIQEPSGVCWDEQGRLFVCELHGYNLDGQIDIDELNKTGKLDMVVRRFFVPEHIEQAAKAGTYGTVKRLIDRDGDGRMDEAQVWADHLPASFGICPARGGIIVVGAPDILFLADRDEDGVAEVRETMFTGFPAGILERRIGTPQWGIDDWIYVGRAHAAATITGPKLAEPVALPNSDFRIKADGSAIEPITGEVHGMGHTMTEDGDRFTSSIGWPAHFAAPLPWKSLARNPFVATGSLTIQVFPDRRVYPTSQPHPWRTRRAEDPGFAKFYTDGWGIAESQPNGYFTSCCGPLVYRDGTLPGLQGCLLACEPAQNLIHRSLIERDGPRLRLKRAPGEESSEFLTSTDAWFHPIALSHSPVGDVWIVDFYREIIEDYSAIPRYLQQQYGVINGKDKGRIWRLARADENAPSTSPDMRRLTDEQLAAEIASTLVWRRETARRLLLERAAAAVAPRIAIHARGPVAAVAINALHTLDSFGALDAKTLATALAHREPGVRRQALRLAESRLAKEPKLLDAALALVDDPAVHVQLQVALSLGEASSLHDDRIAAALARLARAHGDDPWMATAVLSSVPGPQAADLLADLLRSPDELQAARGLLEPLGASAGARRDAGELSRSLRLVASATAHRAAWLKGLRGSFRGAVDVPLTDEGRAALRELLASDDLEARSYAASLTRLMKLESPDDRARRLAAASTRLNDGAENADVRMAAVAELADEDDPQFAHALLAALPSATPRLREALVAAVLARRDRVAVLLDAIESGEVAPTTLSAVQRAALISDKDDGIRERAGRLLQATPDSTLEAFPRYAAALNEARDVARGRERFKETCGKCHQAHGEGVAVGPDLSSEFQRAEETIIRDILAPSETISPGYTTYIVATKDGRVATGLLGGESPTSVVIKQPEGKRLTILRQEIEELRASPASTMPEDLHRTVSPRDVADILAWLRRPQRQVVLLDENHSLAAALSEGDGTVEFVASDKYAGESSLKVTPPQRFSAQIQGWDFKIRERPAPGEYRYIRFAWKAPGAPGVMVELAADGQWPAADSTERRYFAGRNLSKWQAVGVAPRAPSDWTVVTRDLWKDFGDFTLTGFAPTAFDSAAWFDRVELLSEPPASDAGEAPKQ